MQFSEAWLRSLVNPCTRYAPTGPRIDHGRAGSRGLDAGRPAVQQRRGGRDPVGGKAPRRRPSARVPGRCRRGGAGHHRVRRAQRGGRTQGAVRPSGGEAARDRNQGRQGAWRRVLRHAVLDQGTGPGRRGRRPDGAACGCAGGRGFPGLAQPRRYPYHPETHPQPRGLPVAAGRGARGRGDHRRRGASAADTRNTGPYPRYGAAARSGKRGLPAVSGARGARHRRAGAHPPLDGGTAGAQRYPPAAGAGRHHQLRAARTRPADACLRTVAPQRRHRGAANWHPTCW